MPWCLEPFAEGRRRASPLGSCAAAAAGSGFFSAQVWSFFHFLHFIPYHEGRAALDPSSLRKREAGAPTAAEADILNSRERRRIGFHDRVAQSWGDLQVVWQRPRSFSVMDARREKAPTVGTWLFMSIAQTNGGKKERERKKKSVFKFCKLRLWLIFFLFNTQRNGRPRVVHVYERFICNIYVMHPWFRSIAAGAWCYYTCSDVLKSSLPEPALTFKLEIDINIYINLYSRGWFLLRIFVILLALSISLWRNGKHKWN